MADAISDLTTLTSDSTITNLVDTVDADEHNTHRTNYRNQINKHKTVLEEQDKNYASTTEPTVKSEGKIWSDTTSDPAVLKYYKDGSTNLETLVGLTLTQTLTNKTFTSPTITSGSFTNPTITGGSAPLSRNENLVVNNNLTNPNYQLDISADWVTVYADDDSGPGIPITLTSTKTADITISGAGGLDTGAEAVSTWYYVYVIYKSSDGTKEVLLSVSESSPTMPSGYDYKRIIGAVRNDGSSNFLVFDQRGNTVNGGNNSFYSGNTSGIESIDISTFVPKTATSVFINFYKVDVDHYYIRTYSKNNTVLLQEEYMDNLEALPSNNVVYFNMEVPLSGTQTIKANINSAGTGGATTHITGWKY